MREKEFAQKYRLNILEDVTSFSTFAGDDQLNIVLEKTLHQKYKDYSPQTTKDAVQPQLIHYKNISIDDYLPNDSIHDA